MVVYVSIVMFSLFLDLLLEYYYLYNNNRNKQ